MSKNYLPPLERRPTARLATTCPHQTFASVFVRNMAMYMMVVAVYSAALSIRIPARETYMLLFTAFDTWCPYARKWRWCWSSLNEIIPEVRSWSAPVRQYHAVARSRRGASGRVPPSSWEEHWRKRARLTPASSFRESGRDKRN
jgi:hypothetical protein